MARLKGRSTIPPLPVLVTLLIVALVLIVVSVRQLSRRVVPGPGAAQPTLAPLVRIPSAPTTLTAKVKTAANFRTGPSVQAPILRLLAPGTSVRLVARQQAGGANWYVVQVAGQEGWLSDQVLEIDPSVGAFVPLRTATAP